MEEGERMEEEERMEEGGEKEEGKNIQSFKGCVFCVCSCVRVLTGAFVWEPDLALDVFSNPG